MEVESGRNQECFICTESSPVPFKSACHCTGLFVHEYCLRKMLKTRSDITCPVCGCVYSNVTVLQKREFRFFSLPTGLLCFGVAIITLTATTVNTWVAYRRREELGAALQPLMVAAVIFTYFTSMMCTIYLILLRTTCLRLGTNELAQMWCPLIRQFRITIPV